MRSLRLFRRGPLDKEWLPSPYEQALFLLGPRRLNCVQVSVPNRCLVALEPWLERLGREFDPTR